MPDTRRRRWAKRAAVVFGVLTAAVAGANVYMVRTAAARQLATVETAPACAAVIVLGNVVLPNGRPGRELTERLETAYALYHAGRAPRIIASGMVRTGYDEPQAMAAWLVERGVPREDVVLDGRGHRTAATMADAAALGTSSALIATQGYHLPRALYLAHRAGIDAVGVPARSSWRSWFRLVRTHLREYLARAETVVEVALRGVRG